MVSNGCKAAFLYTLVATCYIHVCGHSIERGRRMLREGLGLGLSTAGGGGSASTTCTTTPAAYIASNPDLSILSSALQSSGLSTSLNSYYSAYTIFAPTNAAFETLFSQKGTTLEALQTTNPDILALILKNHVVPGDALTASDFTIGSTYSTRNQGDTMKLASSLDPIIVQADIGACASIIHIVDIVLVPDFVSIPAATASGSATQSNTGSTTAGTGGASLDVTKVNIGGTPGGSFSSATGSFGGGSFDFSAINIAG